MYRAMRVLLLSIVASQQGHLEVVKELLRGGAAVNQAEKDGYSPLLHGEPAGSPGGF